MSAASAPSNDRNVLATGRCRTLSLEARLRAGLAQMGLAIAEHPVGRLVAYLELLERWNRVFNLTAARTTAAMVDRHLLDSLSVASAIRGRRVLDVGSGAGFPGVPLAIVLVGTEFVLLDANAKRTRFLLQVKVELELENVAIARARIQDYEPSLRFDTIVSRAFSSLHEFVENAGRLCAAGGQLLAMKGRLAEAELAGLPPGYSLTAVRELSVPGQLGARHLVTVTPAGGSAPVEP